MQGSYGSSLSAFLTLLLAVALALLGLLSQWESLLDVSALVIACSACFKVHAACRDTLMARSLLRQLESNWLGKRQSPQPLLGDVYRMLIVLGGSWAVALVLIGMITVAGLPAVVPEAGMLYALIVVIAGLELLNSHSLHTRFARASDH